MANVMELLQEVSQKQALIKIEKENDIPFNANN